MQKQLKGRARNPLDFLLKGEGTIRGGGNDEVATKKSFIPLLCLVLLGGLSMNSSGQSYSPMFTPRSTVQLRLACYDLSGYPVYGQAATYWTEHYPNTNGHFHSSPPPPSPVFSPQFGAPCRSYVNVTFHKEGRALALKWRPATMLFAPVTTQNIATGFPLDGSDPIYWVEEKDIIVGGQVAGRWKHVGGHTTGHGGNENNHWLTAGAAWGIYYTINDFVAQNPGQTSVCVNDMALPFGGKFDIDRNWDSPHHWHDRGKAVDINTTGSNVCPPQTAGGIPNPLAEQFRQMCIFRGADSQRTLLRPNAQNPDHVHCNWYDPFTPGGG